MKSNHKYGRTRNQLCTKALNIHKHFPPVHDDQLDCLPLQSHGCTRIYVVIVK